ncbi:MAG: hypothetical protein ACK2T3_02520, partial [Candidatus Promineifilaceae bacterium]
VPEDFPVLGPLLTRNFFHEFVGTTIEHTMAELDGLHLVEQAIETLTFNPFPVIMSIAVVFIGLGAGWWIYGRKELEVGQEDPLVRPLGPLYTFLQNKWWWDELYEKLFINPTKFFSRTVVYEWVDRGFIDGTLHLVARSFYAFGRYLKRFEEVVISGGVDWVKDQVLTAAQEFRALQTGKIQEYVLVSVLIAWALAVVVLVINSGLLDGLFN